MSSKDFCYWLMGFFELQGDMESLNYTQIDAIRSHLRLVFKHEIDPSIDGGDPAKKEALDQIHAGQYNQHQNPPKDVFLRC